MNVISILRREKMSRTHYWGCSKFADWLRGTNYPLAAELGEWQNIEGGAKKAHPFRYWLADTGIDTLEKIVFFIPDILYDIKYYINNRWITRTHCLSASSKDISPGSWCDVGNRFLPCLFNELVDFVEIELAWWHVVWDDEAYKKYHAPWYSRGWFRWRTWRSPEAGLANLEWQSNLVWNEDEGLDKDDPRYGKPTSQAIKAQEILDLYTWWTVTYRNRSEPMKASGWLDYCDMMSEKYGPGLASWGKEDKEDKKLSEKTRKIMNKMEADYEKEDEIMMIRLIKVRHGLWT
jgi:hypothetical protein